MSKQTLRGIVLGLAVALLVAGTVAVAQGPAGSKSVAGMEAPAGVNAPPMSDFVEIQLNDRPNLNPAVAYNSKQGEFLAVWEEHIHGGMVAIYGRRVGMDGRTKGPPFPVIEFPNLQYYQPDVAYSPAENQYLVVWVRKVSDADYDVWATPVRWDGVPGNHIRIDIDFDKDWYPAVAYNDLRNEFLVVYEKVVVADSRRDIEARRVRASNWSLASWRNLAGGDNELRRLPDVAYNLARDEYLIAYTGQTAPLNPINVRGDIYGLRSNYSMSSLSAEFLITTAGDPPQDSVALAAGPNEYLAVWYEDHGANMDSIWARRVAGNGALQSFINIAHQSGQRHVEAAAALGDGGHYLVAWRQSLGTSPNLNFNIRGRTVRQGQNSTEGPAFDIDIWQAQQKNPDVACAATSRCLVVYEDDWPGGPTAPYNIRGRLVGHVRAFVPVTLRRFK
jgi:hypothetical protein